MLTTEELFREYIKLFKLIVETAGYTVNNKSYLEVEKILEKEEKNIKLTIEQDIPFTPFVATLIFYVILDIHGIENLEGDEKIDKIKELIDDFGRDILKDLLENLHLSMDYLMLEIYKLILHVLKYKL